MPTSRSEHTATVWASTFVPTKAPFQDWGAEGYSVAWVDTAEGRRQVLVEGSRPAPGTVGRLISRPFGEETVELFTEDAR